MDGKNVLLGVACGVAAGALWGLAFIAPAAARDFGPLHLAAGRYLAYGLFAGVLVAPYWRRLATLLGRDEWLALARLSLLGNVLYYVLLASAVQLGGTAMSSLVVGLLPVAVTIIGSREQGAAPLRKLAPSLWLSVAGILCIGWGSLAGAQGASLPTQAAGLVCAFAALASWTIFAVSNSRWLGRLKGVSAHDWSLLIGVVTGAEALLLIPLALAFEQRSHTQREWLLFLGVCAALAILASIVGNGLWNRMSRLLPLTMVGQMILFETLFALLYGFLWESRLPTVAEWAAMALVIASVLSCVAAHRPTKESVEAIAVGHE